MKLLILFCLLIPNICKADDAPEKCRASGGTYVLLQCPDCGGICHPKSNFGKREAELMTKKIQKLAPLQVKRTGNLGHYFGNMKEEWKLTIVGDSNKVISTKKNNQAVNLNGVWDITTKVGKSEPFLHLAPCFDYVNPITAEPDISCGAVQIFCPVELREDTLFVGGKKVEKNGSVECSEN